MNDEELDSLTNKGHNPMMAVLQGRSRNLQIVRAMWTSGNTKVETHILILVISLRLQTLKHY
jgi:hypothetical protein